MERPQNVDIWDGVELKRDEALTEEQKQEKIDEAMKMIKESAKRLEKLQKE